ncbi:MAG: NDP-sugar synthase [Myxococcota bacterium]|nr:NDP-sugar synthase [Myxococcota bacterium]
MSRIKGAILAAGRGTRLRPLTHLVPKPLVPVAGRPLIEYALDHLRKLGIEEIGVNAHHLHGVLQEAMQKESPSVTVVVEEVLQGTGGGIRGIARALDADTLVVINGDALFDFDLHPLLEQHRKTRALGTLALRQVPVDSPFRRVGIDQSGRLNVISEMSCPGVSRNTLTFGAYTGVQIIERALIERIPEGECDILRSAYRDVLDNAGPIFGHFVPAGSVWFDVGTPDRYLDAHRLVLEQTLSVEHLPTMDRHGRAIHPGSIVSPTVELIGPCVVMDGAHIESSAVIGPYAYIGEGAHIGPGCRISDAVIWPKVSVDRDLSRQVVLPGH